MTCTARALVSRLRGEGGAGEGGGLNRCSKLESAAAESDETLLYCTHSLAGPAPSRSSRCSWASSSTSSPSSGSCALTPPTPPPDQAAYNFESKGNARPALQIITCNHTPSLVMSTPSLVVPLGWPRDKSWLLVQHRDNALRYCCAGCGGGLPPPPEAALAFPPPPLCPVQRLRARRRPPVNTMAMQRQ